MTTQTMSASVDYKKWGLFALSIAALIAFPTVAMAAGGGLQGGIDDATSAARNIVNGAMTIAGVVAIIYILWKAIQLWQGRCDWGEFGMSIAYVAIAGGSVTLANWAWKTMYSGTGF